MSGSFRVEYADMQNLLGSYSGAVNTWEDTVSAVMDKSLAIQKSSNISGNQFDRMKDYMQTVYSYAYTSLRGLLNLFKQNYLLYIDDYYKRIDSARNARIPQEELEGNSDYLKAKRTTLQQIASQAESSVRQVSDLVAVGALDFSHTDSAFENVLKSLDTLNTRICDLESAHQSKDFTNFDEVYHNLSNFFKEMRAQDKSFIASFSPERFFALSSVPALYTSIQSLYSEMESKQTAVENAAKRLEERLKQEQEELKKREEAAGWAKIGFGILVAVVTLVTAPFVGPVGFIVVSSIGTGLSWGFNASADEYVEHGWNMGEWNMDRIEMHCLIGAASGAVSTLVAPGLGNCAKASIKAVTGTIDSTLVSAYDQLQAYGSIEDVESLVYNAGVNAASKFAGNVVGYAVSDSISESIQENRTLNRIVESKLKGYSADGMVGRDTFIEYNSKYVMGGKEQIVSVFIDEGSSELGSGAVKRFTSTATKEYMGFKKSLAEGKSVAEAYNEHRFIEKSVMEAVDGKEIVGDLGSGLVSAYTHNPVQSQLRHMEYREPPHPVFGDAPDLSKHPEVWEDWDSEQYNQMEIKLDEMNARGEDTWLSKSFGEPNSTDPRQNNYGPAARQAADNQHDWERTSLTREEEAYLREIDRGTGMDYDEVDFHYDSEPELPKQHLPSTTGIFTGERGNSTFIPSDPSVQAIMKDYGQDGVSYVNGEVDFNPFSIQESPWGELDTKVDIPHMTENRLNPTYEFGRRTDAHDPLTDLGNYNQADNELAKRYGVEPKEVEKWRKANDLVWHEYSDGKTMQLLPSKIHEACVHSGGVSTAKYIQEWGDVDKHFYGDDET